MNRFLRLACLMVTLAVAPSATFPTHAPRAAQNPGCSERSGIQEGACASQQGSPTLAFYIPRPLRDTFAFYIPRPLRGPQV